MQLVLYSYSGKRNKINKHGLFYNKWVANGTLRDNTSFLHPIITIEKTTPPMQSSYNYMYLPEFKRFYFINDIVSRGLLWEIHADVDVLFSNYKDIYESKAIISKSEGVNDSNLYLNDGSFVMDSHKFDQTVYFPNGLSETGYNILICAGGNANV